MHSQCPEPTCITDVLKERRVVLEKPSAISGLYPTKQKIPCCSSRPWKLQPHNLLGKQKCCTRMQAPWCCQEPHQPWAISGFSWHHSKPTPHSCGCVCTFKAVLTSIDVSKFCTCVFKPLVWWHQLCFWEGKLWKKMYKDISCPRSSETACNLFLVLFLKLLLLSETYQHKPAKTKITRASGLIDGYVQSHCLIDFALVAV